jgi:hypothetical protein
MNRVDQVAQHGAVLQPRGEGPCKDIPGQNIHSVRIFQYKIFSKQEYFRQNIQSAGIFQFKYSARRIFRYKIFSKQEYHRQNIQSAGIFQFKIFSEQEYSSSKYSARRIFRYKIFSQQEYFSSKYTASRNFKVQNIQQAGIFHFKTFSHLSTSDPCILESKRWPAVLHRWRWPTFPRASRPTRHRGRTPPPGSWVHAATRPGLFGLRFDKGWNRAIGRGFFAMAHRVGGDKGHLGIFPAPAPNPFVPPWALALGCGRRGRGMKSGQMHWC